ncbi:MFS transporter [Arthrobacter zhangbolii]|uniref:MFS transporter n=1 Tax=Arthrobacter zhangbolii TaxID=2886936 RepID=A0A9X1M813_9MICC|nr:MFS transporter [Arthrobacter zhangbolii]MCC3272582.1 MFS transporter [Arthrobacter zhangbolii]MCC3293937.1 MFS transporter [Arthrobacter zhangbolii]UON91569.1 MFS transporter [Arthrobacter zhangbolii]
MPADDFSLRRIAVPAYGPTLLYGLATGAILPVVALSARDLGATVALAALVITLTGVGSLLTNVPATVVTTRFGERWALAAAAAWCALAMILAASVPVLWVFALAVFMTGMAGSVFGLARQSYLTEAVPLHFRARALSTLGGVNRIGVFIGPFAGAGAIHFLGTAGAYWVGAAAAVGAGLLSLTVPDLSVRAAAKRNGTRPGPGTAAAAAAVPTPTVRAILRSHARVFRTIGIGILLIAAVRATRQAVIPLWGQHIGLDPTQTALIYGLSGAIDMLIFYPAGKAMDTWGRRSVAVPCMLVMGVGLGLLPLATDATGLLLAALLIGFGNGIGSGIVMTLGADFSPSPGRPQFLGIWRLLADLGNMGGPGILAGVTALVSLSAGIAATALLGLAGAVVLWCWVPKGKPGRSASAAPDRRPAG